MNRTTALTPPAPSSPPARHLLAASPATADADQARRLRPGAATSSGRPRGPEDGGGYEVNADLDRARPGLDLDLRRPPRRQAPQQGHPHGRQRGRGRHGRHLARTRPARTRSRFKPAPAGGGSSVRRRHHGRRQAGAELDDHPRRRRTARRPATDRHRTRWRSCRRWRGPARSSPRPTRRGATTSRPSGKPGPVVLDGQHQPAARRAARQRDRDRGALGGVGEDVVEQHVDQRHEVLLGGADRHRAGGVDTASRERRGPGPRPAAPRTAPARPAPPRRRRPATSPSRSERRASRTTWSTIASSSSRSAPSRSRSSPVGQRRRPAAAAR